MITSKMFLKVCASKQSNVQVKWWKCDTHVEYFVALTGQAENAAIGYKRIMT